MPEAVEPHERRRQELTGLLADHRVRVTALPAQVVAHSLMPRDAIQRAEQQNLARAVGLGAACRRYADEVRLLVDRHRREEAEERGGAVGEEIHTEASGDPPAAPGERE